MKREYYVYVSIRLDTNQAFYIGKGKRFIVPKKNINFMNIYKKYDTVVYIVEDGLTNEEALWLEREYIEDYVFNMGFGINIKWYKDSDVGKLVNCTWGEKAQ